MKSITITALLLVLVTFLVACGGGGDGDSGDNGDITNPPNPDPNPNPNPNPNPIDATGTLDNSFDTDGLAVYENLRSEGRAIVLDGSNRIVVAGDVADVTNKLAVWRVLPNGSLDTSFGNNGYVSYRHNPGNIGAASAWAVAVDNAGRIVVTGKTSSSSDELLLVRFNEDGSLDNGFGTNGAVSYAGVTGNSLIINSDNSIFVTGRGAILMRFTADGVLDTSLGNNGVVSDGTAFGDDAIKDKDGNILIAGVRFTTDSLITVWRYLPNGDIDMSFGTNGRFTDFVGARHSLAGNIGNHIAVDSNDNIYVSAESGDSTNTDRILLKLDQNGSLLTNFGTNGVVSYDSGNHDWGRKLVIVNDRIIVTGTSVVTNFSSSDMQLIRYNPDGTLDTTFGQSGIVNTDNYVIERGWGIVADTTGRLLIAGAVWNLGSGSDINMAIWRFN